MVYSSAFASFAMMLAVGPAIASELPNPTSIDVTNPPIDVTTLRVKPFPVDPKAVYASLSTKSLDVSFRNVRHDGKKVVGSVTTHWEEDVFGNRVVLVDRDDPFSIWGEMYLFVVTVDVYGVPILVYGKLKVEGDQKLCLELRANWPGGNLGDVRCTYIQTQDMKVQQGSPP